ncbi:RNA methyltransferase [Propioniciclava coleopterorum]|uniref:RNA methyltransferase n=1 Tax=Propioniciclava coleopterorum TaxID=2714937 RepID=A0A6G7Y918_9ACTN|nr:RNA methyltransferase [Propioniciclava coleopterorum]QIK73209.1 RNA methyltransferase [Propioniciclava coleopterorum]
MSEERLELDEPSKAVLREARALLRAKERRASGRFLVEGRQGVREALERPGVVQWLFVRWANAHDNLDLIALARETGVPVYAVSEQNLATMSDTVSPQGVTAVANAVGVPLEQALAPREDGRPVRLVVVCAQIRDPGNAGTVIRCADAFGADAVIMSTDSVDLHNPKVVRASVGSMFHLPIVTGVELTAALDACRAAGLTVLATDGEADTTLLDVGDDLARPTAWVMGNEAWGLPTEHLALADRSVAVPLYGSAESLNLATAAAICLYTSATAQRAAAN